MPPVPLGIVRKTSSLSEALSPNGICPGAGLAGLKSASLKTIKPPAAMIVPSGIWNLRGVPPASLRYQPPMLIG